MAIAPANCNWWFAWCWVWSASATNPAKLRRPTSVSSSIQLSVSVCPQSTKGKSMKKAYALLFGLLALPLAQRVLADSSSCVTTGSTISCVGNSTAPQNVYTEPFVSGGTTLTVQTFSFGGGTNPAGKAIPEGSFMPLTARYSSHGVTLTVAYLLN